MTLTAGLTLADRYQLTRRIAVGGMGEVWEGLDSRLHRQVAVKVLKAELSGDPEFAQRFRAEARTTASLNHPGIAAVHDFGETATTPEGPADTPFLVMELVPGQALSAVITRQHRLPPDQALDILEQAGDALQAAHQRGLVHRDIKPGNILVTPTGTVKLTDFGIAKAVDAAPVTRTGTVLGTAHYIAPEQASGGGNGPASDIYSLGVVGYECLAGHRPFEADSAITVAMMHIRDTPPPLPSDVPAGVRTLIDAAMAKEPRQRYATGGEFARAVTEVRAGRSLPLPAGWEAPTEQLSGDYPTTAPRTALLPPGPLSSGQTRSDLGGRQAARDVRPPPDQRRRRRSGAAGWVMSALLLVALLALGAWAISQALQPTQGPGGTAGPTALPDGQQQPADPGRQGAPTPQDQPPPGQVPPPTTAGPTATTTAPDTVTVDEIDYLGDTGEDAADQLEQLGLEPRVVDGGGEELGGGDQEECRVTDVEPDGEVERGSTVTVTCLGSSG